MSIKESVSTWYYRIHPSGGVSVFDTDQYSGLGGFESKKEATLAAYKSLVNEQNVLNLKLLETSKELSNIAFRLERISAALLILNNDEETNR
jgi:hypothetical protein